jgi:hypothetical protein
MSSPEQIEANRLNGMQSSGPKTTEGKAASRMNALTHGLLSREVLLPNEDGEAFDVVSDRCRAELNPQSELESMLVDRIIGLAWRLSRLGRIEVGILRWQHFAALADRAGAKAAKQTKPTYVYTNRNAKR